MSGFLALLGLAFIVGIPLVLLFYFRMKHLGSAYRLS